MVGFKELLRRLQIQEQMTKQHQTRVDVSKNISAAAVSSFSRGKQRMGTKLFDYQRRNLTHFCGVKDGTDVQLALGANTCFNL